jgi:hypothetical protein
MIQGGVGEDQAVEFGDGDSDSCPAGEDAQSVAAGSAVEVEAIRAPLVVVIGEGNHIRLALCFEADVGNVSGGQELAGFVVGGTFGVLANDGSFGDWGAHLILRMTGESGFEKIVS